MSLLTKTRMRMKRKGGTVSEQREEDAEKMMKNRRKVPEGQKKACPWMRAVISAVALQSAR